MYPKQFFTEQFSEVDSDELLLKLSSDDLVDNAKEGIRDILVARGMSVAEIERVSKDTHKARYRVVKGTLECDYCGNSARYKPVLDEGQRFCSKKCLHHARISEAAVDLTEPMILLAAGKIRSGACPVCDKMNTPVEVRYAYTAMSFIVVSNQKTKTRLCCVQCGRKENIESMLVSFFIGWWGIPWGPIFTIAALFENLKAMFEMTAIEEPSDELLKAARYQLAVNALEKRLQVDRPDGTLPHSH
ncbi:hypothetical protein H8L32_09460 [Undibacterium sp. CY18W]|uniref:Uncharacterized protein n=1 Tax=Undibacterium hunanense TaxID=2762292 RepID=A0ABR6ZPB7_9BURK|nr:hypothetical protein [Undibacterium hunanense]MBC3917698.1 hypothetical protein [Undibacterium hunanense]